MNLVAQATGQQALALQATAKDKFSYADEGIILEFNPADKAMVLKQHGQISNFTRE